MWQDPWAPESQVEGRKKEDRQAQGLGPGALGACLLRTDLHGMGVGGREDIKGKPRGTWTSACFPDMAFQRAFRRNLFERPEGQ